MERRDHSHRLRDRSTPLDMSPEEFRRVGRRVVDSIAALLESLPDRPVTPAEAPGTIREFLNASRGLPEEGIDAEALFEEATELLFDHSLFNGHPRFLGLTTLII